MRVVFLSLLFVALASSFGYDANPVNKEKEPATLLDKKLMLELVNNARKKGCQCGDTYYYQAPPLKWNDKLEKAAIQHSRDMLEKKYFNHSSPDGAKAGRRLDKLGYRWKAYGENIAHGYSTEKQVVDGWLRSPGHCRNIMSKMYKEIGVGRYGSYWTQTFGTSK